jgi:hypothetical protein
MATYHDIHQATCLNCGLVTLDADRLEIMNDLDPACEACGYHCVAWITSDRFIITNEKASKEVDRTEIIF